MTPQAIPSVVLTGDLIELMDLQGIIPWDAGKFADAAYALPDAGWVGDEFALAFRSFIMQLKQGTWTSEANDCDDFARAAAFFAQYLHHNTPDKSKGTSLAFGEFWYEPSGGPHAINIFVYRDAAGALRVGFFEPQTFMVVQLSVREWQSCAYYRF